MKIAGREIGPTHPPYLIAEISCNHNGSLDRAFELIKAAKAAGADAVKFQAYTPDTITLNIKKTDFIIQEGIWRGRSLYELYQKAHTPFEWLPHLFGRAQAEGITAFASVFDNSSVDLLDKIGCPAYKIASFEIVDIPLISYTACKGKPMIISTGAASDREILDAAEAAPLAAFLHCTSEYPGTTEQANLWRIKHIDQLLKHRHLVGLSDHTPGMGTVPAVATALGACIIEKHLKHGKDETSEDSLFSLTPKQFSFMVESVGIAWNSMQPREVSSASKQFRRSLYAVSDIKEGDAFTKENVRSIRPGYGLAPKKFSYLMGKKAQRNFRRGDPIVL